MPAAFIRTITSSACGSAISISSMANPPFPSATAALHFRDIPFQFKGKARPSPWKTTGQMPLKDRYFFTALHPLSAGILIGRLFRLGHFQSVKLALRNGPEVMVGLDIACEGLR